jgi:hypothetical protein
MGEGFYLFIESRNNQLLNIGRNMGGKGHSDELSSGNE